MRIKIIVVVIILFLSSTAWGGVTTGVRTFSFTPSARALGMGEAYVANLGDIDSVCFNPAGLGKIKTSQIGFTHFKCLADTFYAFTGYGFPLDSRVILASSVLYFDGGDIELNYTDGTSETKKAQQDIVLTLSVAKNISKNRFAGLNLKVISSRLLTEHDAITFGMDGGVIYNFGENKLKKLLQKGLGISIKKDSLNWGMALKNLGPKLKYGDEGDALPLSVNTGIIDCLSLDQNHKINFAFDLIKPIDLTLRYHTGLEYRFRDFLALRVGSRIGYDTLQFTSGIGFNLIFLQVDYAFVSMSELPLNHRVSLVYRFK